MVQKIYIDTSIIGGKFDKEFELYTSMFFNRVFAGEFKLLISDLLIAELDGAPKHVIEFFNSLPDQQIENLSLNEDAINLAESYLNEKVVGQTSRADCRHIALASLANADILISWNFKHIVNLTRIRGYNSVNLKTGIKPLEIRTPREVIEYES